MGRVYERHYGEEAVIAVSPQALFDFVDDHDRFSAHMNQPSVMTGGGRMETKLDEGRGRRVGSHITMGGKVFGFTLFLDEVVTSREVPTRKSWETVGEPRLLVVGDYAMTLDVVPVDGHSRLRVSIDYDLPRKHRWLGRMFGTLYAAWCVRRMLNGAREQFKEQNAI